MTARVRGPVGPPPRFQVFALPGSGTGSLVNYLQSLGHYTVHETLTADPQLQRTRFLVSWKYGPLPGFEQLTMVRHPIRVVWSSFAVMAGPTFHGGTGQYIERFLGAWRARELARENPQDAVGGLGAHPERVLQAFAEVVLKAYPGALNARTFRREDLGVLRAEHRPTQNSHMHQLSRIWRDTLPSWDGLRAAVDPATADALARLCEGLGYDPAEATGTHAPTTKPPRTLTRKEQREFLERSRQ